MKLPLVVERKKHPILDAHEIVPNLWQGSIPPMGSGLAAAGFDYVVLCAREYQPPADAFRGVQVIHAPNDDDPRRPASREMLRTALEVAREVSVAMHRSRNCLVTCAAGMNRSGLVSALALHLAFDWAGLKCIQTVRERRGPAGDGYQPLSNPQFVAALQQLRPKR